MALSFLFVSITGFLVYVVSWAASPAHPGSPVGGLLPSLVGIVALVGFTLFLYPISQVAIPLGSLNLEFNLGG
jgi:hypothetical protein